jgi:23S rRNA pseudouridine955/2504/2580 synthase
MIELREGTDPAAPAYGGPAGSAPRRTRLAIDILWEGAGLLVLNKPAGLTVHGPESLEDRVRDYLCGKLPPSLSFRPGPLHRLDKPTSGVIVFSASLEGARRFSTLLRDGRVRKTYLALVEGILDGGAYWEDLLVRDRGSRKTRTLAGRSPAPGGPAKEARTKILPLAAAESAGRAYTLLEAELDTGRTHQIRTQAAARGYPLAGDRKYGGRFREGGFLLHAYTLKIPGLPDTEDPLFIRAPLPEPFRRAVVLIFGEKTLENFC